MTKVSACMPCVPVIGVPIVGMARVAGVPNVGSGSNNRLGSISSDEGFPGHNSVEDVYGDGGAVSAPHLLDCLISRSNVFALL